MPSGKRNSQISEEMHKLRMFILSESCNRKSISDQESEERDRLRNLFNYQKDLLEYERKEQIRKRLIDDIKKTINYKIPDLSCINDPALGDKSFNFSLGILPRLLGRWEASTHHESVFVNRYPERGLSVHDIQQGGIGDCYLLAAIASILIHADGMEFIDRMIEPIDDNHVMVRFFHKFDGANGRQACYVIIKTTLPKIRFNNVIPHAATYAGTWLALIEKAYACFKIALGYPISPAKRKVSTAYSHIASGDFSSNLYTHMLGVDGNVDHNYKDFNEDYIKHMTFTLFKLGTPIVVSFTSDCIINGVKYYSRHAYAIVGVTDRGVKLFNPWGADQASSNEITYQVLCSHLNSIDSGQVCFRSDNTEPVKVSSIYQTYCKLGDQYRIIANQLVL